MDMLSVLLPAAFAGYFFLGPAVFPVQHFRNLAGQIVFLDLAVETVDSAGRHQFYFVLHVFSFRPPW
jgi:hypothetical protein